MSKVTNPRELAKKLQNVEYFGDEDLEAGGMFYSMAEWDNGYVEVVEVDDLDSACGAEGLVLITIGVVNTPILKDGEPDGGRHDAAIMENAKGCLKDGESWDWDNPGHRLAYVRELIAYWGVESHRSIVVFVGDVSYCDRSKWDTWTPEVYLTSEDFPGWLFAKHLADEFMLA